MAALTTVLMKVTRAATTTGDRMATRPALLTEARMLMRALALEVVGALNRPLPRRAISSARGKNRAEIPKKFPIFYHLPYHGG